ncbi:MAG: type II toxin-antitoxin system VapC family toxin [Deltaproteobacteria bacterium]|nr:type II toxin-antitoxin system VapC family toxin [Deltaproteobacteria bacterium]
MIYCLDTDILIEYFRGSEAIKRKIESLTGDDSLGVIWLTFYEFFKGIFVSGKLGEEKFLQSLNETCLILNPSYEAARMGGEIYATLRREGKLINDADILIASIVKAHDAVLVTNNEEHFSRIEGLKIDNWLRP